MGDLIHFPGSVAPAKEAVASSDNADFPDTSLTEDQLLVAASKAVEAGECLKDVPESISAESRELRAELVAGYTPDEVAHAMHDSSHADWMTRPAYYRALAIRFLREFLGANY